MYTISKEFHFSASHVLYGLPESHPCSRLHGHNYVVRVEIQSNELNPVGFVTDYRGLDNIKNFIDDRLDHRHLNDWMSGYKENPTAENIARRFFDIFKTWHPGLISVEIQETPKTIARYEPRG